MDLLARETSATLLCAASLDGKGHGGDDDGGNAAGGVVTRGLDCDGGDGDYNML